MRYRCVSFCTGPNSNIGTTMCKTAPPRTSAYFCIYLYTVQHLVFVCKHSQQPVPSSFWIGVLGSVKRHAPEARKLPSSLHSFYHWSAYSTRGGWVMDISQQPRSPQRSWPTISEGVHRESKSKSVVAICQGRGDLQKVPGVDPSA
jgi:hypothetical protein